MTTKTKATTKTKTTRKKAASSRAPAKAKATTKRKTAARSGTAAKKTAPRKRAAKKAPAKKKAARRAPAKGAVRVAKPVGLTAVVTAALDEMKAQHVTVLDVRGVTDVADTIVIASGTSDRHVKSLATRVLERAREAGHRPIGVEGEREGEWVLADLGDVIVHVMLPRVREFYALEKLWDVRSAERAPAP